MKIFIHHDGALGDILCSLPCLWALRKSAGFVHIAAMPEVGRLLHLAGYADEASSPGSIFYASLYGSGVEAGVKRFLGQFDRAFVFTTQADALFIQNLLEGIPDVRVIKTIPPKGRVIHVTEFRAGQLTITDKDIEYVPPLSIPAIQTQEAWALPGHEGIFNDGRRLIAFHPGSGGKSKCWPLENYFELIERIMQHDACCIILSGPAESEAVKERIAAFAQNRRGVVHTCNAELAAVAALLCRCMLYVGNDSGITHLAAAVNSPVIAIFGPTDSRIWRPLGRRVEVITPEFSGTALSSITVDEVYSRVRMRI